MSSKPAAKIFRIAMPVIAVFLTLFAAGAWQEAQAALADRGPVDPENGFPVWYMDGNGTALSLCADPDNPLCLADPVIPGNAYSQQVGFGAEAFWWSAEALMDVPPGGALPDGGRALLVTAMEAAWLNEEPAPGDQMSFGRLRIRIDVPQAGTYTVVHPFGQAVFNITQERMDETGGIRAIDSHRPEESGMVSSNVPVGDVGCEAEPCDFDAALASGIGPFLKWDPAVAPAAPAGYLGDPLVDHRITGGVNNRFAITGPNIGGPGVNVLQTDLFSVTGKLFSAEPAPGDSFWTWYDHQGMRSWLMMANPADAEGDLTFNVSIGGMPKNPGDIGSGEGIVPPGGVMASSFPGIMGGPVAATAFSPTGERAVVSQRILLGDSLDEVPGTEFERLSDRFLWPWYDSASPGYANWIIVSNPHTAPVFYRITIAGAVKAAGQIPAGSQVTPIFPGTQGGPVEVQAWADGVGGAEPAQVLASQRVTSSFGKAFNEEPGIPAGTTVSEISNRYNWNWYDMSTPGAGNWLVIANPQGAAGDIFYQVKIGDFTSSGGPVAPGSVETASFPGLIGGPVQVSTFSDAGLITPANSIASQRVVWGPSIEETPGKSGPALDSTYHWTWYDMASTGSTNWIMIANPFGATAPIFYEIMIAGEVVQSGGPIAPGTGGAANFPGTMDGPVEVNTFTGAVGGTPADSIAAQRVIWKGHLNEVTGTSLLPPVAAQPIAPPLVPPGLLPPLPELGGLLDGLLGGLGLLGPAA